MRNARVAYRLNSVYKFIHRRVAKHKQKQLTMKNNNRTR